MDQAPEQNEAALSKTVRDLAQLQREIDDARTDLGRLHPGLGVAALDDGAQQLRDANQQLVLTTLRAHEEAEAALRALAEMSRAAEFDALTGLANRRLMLDRLTRALASAKRYGRRLALLFIDLNNFKQINDTLGHQAGDQILKLVADRLSAGVRESDMVSRFGGDEFLVLLTEISQMSDALPLAEALISALDAPSQIGNHLLHLTASVGISIYPEDGEDAETLIALADAAMYRAKGRGNGGLALRGVSIFTGRDPTDPRPLDLRQPADDHARELADSLRRNQLLREANEQLIVAALSAQELTEAAEQADRQQREVLAMVAHELRNPLAPIRNAASLLSRVRSDELPRMQAIIERQVQHMARLVGDLLDFARINAGTISIDRRLLDLTEIVDEAIDVCRPAMVARKQNFSVIRGPLGVKISADPLRLVQVISNLLDNASKYTPEGGSIHLSLEMTDNNFIVSISDSGMGISAEALPDIFNPFTRAPEVLRVGYAGMGIGLTVVRALAEAHGGSITAASAGIGQGSCFTVTLPRTDEQLKDEPAARDVN